MRGTILSTRSSEIAWGPLCVFAQLNKSKKTHYVSASPPLAFSLQLLKCFEQNLRGTSPPASPPLPLLISSSSPFISLSLISISAFFSYFLPAKSSFFAGSFAKTIDAHQFYCARRRICLSSLFSEEYYEKGLKTFCSLESFPSEDPWATEGYDFRKERFVYYYGSSKQTSMFKNCSQIVVM